MMLSTAESSAPTIFSLTSEQSVDTLLIFAVSSPLGFFEKNVGESRKVRAMMAFCTCNSMICCRRMIYRFRVSVSNSVPTVAPISSPVIGSRSAASPVGITVSKMSLLAIGVNIPSSTTTSAHATSNRAFGPDTTLQVKRIRSFMVSGCRGRAFVKVMAVGFSWLAIS